MSTNTSSNHHQGGEAFLLLPGLICDHRIFAGLLATLPQALAAACYGSADNIVDMAARVLAAAPDRFGLLGHSMGARVALEIVRAAPERVTRLALVSTGVHPVQPGEAEKRHALRDLGRTQGMDALVDQWLPPMVSPDRLDDEALMTGLRAMCVDAGLARFEAQIAALLNRPEVESLLPEIRCPVLVVVGRQDRWSPPEQHQAMAAQIRGAHLRVVEGAGHMLPAEQPDALGRVIKDWLESGTRT